jgi:hypothetical protein
MKRIARLKHEFVRSIPEKLINGVLYVSVDYGTAAHNCCCGCGREVITPLSPTDWKLIYDGVSISLHPSIGNWSFDCRSHYWIEHNRIKWAEQWSPQRISVGRAMDRRAKTEYYPEPAGSDQNLATGRQEPTTDAWQKSFWTWLKAWLSP